MATITYRALDVNGEPLWGSGQANFVPDISAVAQAIQTRLQLLLGEWWESLGTGTPMFQSILGAGRSTQAVSAILRTQILGTPYVTEVSEVAGSYNAHRGFLFSCKVQTQFGTIQVVNQPGSNASIAR